MSKKVLPLTAVWLASLTALAADFDDDRLRRAGVEPTTRGVQEYFERYLQPADAKEPSTLIERLGADDFRDRERAMERLTDIGFPAAKELEAATDSTDPEIAWRAKAILVAVRNGRKRATLVDVLKAVEAHQIPVGLPLLLRVRATTTSDQVRAACDAAMNATVAESDRETVTKLIDDDQLELRNVGRLLLVRLDPSSPAPLLEGTFDAVDVTIGSVAGGGKNLIDGWEFKPKSDLRVTHLGVLDHGVDGLWDAHPVAIWDLENKKAPIAELTIPAGQEAPLASVFRLLPLKKAATLEAGKRYAVVALYPETKTIDNNVGMINPSGLTVKFGPHLEIGGRRYAFPHKAMAYPGNLAAGENRATIGPTFRYEVAP